jgi:hypothetical protein
MSSRKNMLPGSYGSRIDYGDPFERYIPEPNTGCWLWIGSSFGPGKYGQMYRRGEGGRVRMIGAHRAFWERENGPVPVGMYVCHRCDTPPCVNTSHLFLGTARDNNRDMVAKGRAGNPRALRELDSWVLEQLPATHAGISDAYEREYSKGRGSTRIYDSLQRLRKKGLVSVRDRRMQAPPAVWCRPGDSEPANGFDEVSPSPVDLTIADELWPIGSIGELSRVIAALRSKAATDALDAAARLCEAMPPHIPAAGAALEIRGLARNDIRTTSASAAKDQPT